MTTIWVDNGSERGDHNYQSRVVDERISDVGEWLERILGDHHG
jgi:putative hydrolase of the HAD superfamily